MLGVVAFLLCVTGGIASKCTLQYNPSSPPIFIQKFGSNNIILHTRDGQLSWDERTTVNAYCPSEFRHLKIEKYNHYGSYDGEEVSSLQYATFSCSDSQVNFESSDTSESTPLRNNGALSCFRTARYYEALVPACEYQGLAFGFFIGKQDVVLAEVCYNLDELQPRFLHYVAGARSTILESQPDYNINNLTTSCIEVFIDSSNLEVEKQSLLEAVEKSIPQYADAVLYQLHTFIPLEESLGDFGSYTYDFQSVNMIPWWTPLKFGNWRLIEKAIATISRNETYDIFAGTSGVVIYPNNDNCLSTDLLTYKVNSKVRMVPKYIWNYIKKREQSEEGVVVIGVNTPFFDSSKNDHIICKDICDSLPWLSFMQMSRKLAGLGYIFCCKPVEVKNKLDHFPNL